MNYHIVLDMHEEDIKDIKRLSVETGKPAKEVVADAVLYYLSDERIQTILGKNGQIVEE